MGMHTGEGALGGDDYLGIDVNHAARIAATGHGGQVVISDATRALVAASLPDGVSVRDLGVHRLKDFDEAEHLHDLVIPGLDPDFPQLRSLGGRRSNLPSYRTSFVGRSREVAEVGRLLDAVRLLTLTGPGGTGKTRLALAVAAERLDRHPDGVVFVDLSRVTGPALVIPEIARALRVQELPGRDISDILREHLRERELLLVLDNLEQLVEASPVIGELLDTAPDLVVLATSRIPLRLSGEQEYQVSPLALPTPGNPAEPVETEHLLACASVQLFVERAMAARPGFRITREQAPALAEIVARLDGLPLALELAGSRMRVLDLDALATRLEQRLPMLIGGARDLPERQRTLEAAIAWSHELLDPDEQRLFARLSVFSGGWTLEAAEAVCGPDLDVFEILGTLADDSLVRRTDLDGGGLRFSMLETIREYATGRLAAADGGELERVRHRHAEFFRDLAEEAEPHLTGGGQAEWLEILEREHENLRAAIDQAAREPEGSGIPTGLRTCAAIWRFWQQRGRMAEGRSRLEDLLAHPAAERRDAVRARALGALGSLAYWQTDYARVPERYGEAVEIAREVGDRRLLSHALLDLSFVQDYTPKALEERAALLEESLRVAEDDDHFLNGQIWTAFGYLKMFHGDVEGAAERLQGAVAFFRQSGNRFALSEGLSGLAGIAFMTGDMAEMHRHLQEATAIVTEASSPVFLLGVLLPYARVANAEGRHRDAARLVGAYNRVEADFDVHIPDIGVVFLGDPAERAREALGDQEFEVARSEGFASSAAQLLSLVEREASLGAEPEAEPGAGAEAGADPA
jgi:predicted ATPase